MNFSCTQTLKNGNPCKSGLPFRALKDSVLGTYYILSLVFIGDARSRRLNKTYRGKDRPADVLSFPLSKTEGEIFISPRQAARGARARGMTPKEYTALLFIHALLHLKGYRHGSTMEKEEKRLWKKFLHRA